VMPIAVLDFTNALFHLDGRLWKVVYSMTKLPATAYVLLPM